MSSSTLRHARRSLRERWGLLRPGAGWWLAGLLLLAPPASAQTYAVVKTTDDIPPFEAAIEGVKRAAGGTAVVGSLEADASRWPKVQEKLAKKSPTIWVPVGPLALKSAAQVDAPVVFVMVATPERSLGGSTPANVCGVTLRLAVDVQLREIKSILPDAKKLGVLYDPGNAVSAREVTQAQAAAGGLGLSVVPAQMSDSKQLAGKLDELLGQGIDALWLIADRTVTPPRNADAFKYIAETTAKASVPVVGYADKLTQAGALFSLGPDYGDIGVQAGEMVQQVAGGAAPSDLGIVNARKISLSVNTRVASALGVSLPGDALGRAAAKYD